MERRVAERKRTKMDIRFPCFGTFYSGTVRDLSANGMFINTLVCFPFGSTLEILIQSKKEVLKVPVKVNRVVNTWGIDMGMGVELLSLPREYLELLIKLDMGCLT
jgi:hypothetical protein